MVEKTLADYQKELQEYRNSLGKNWENDSEKVFVLARKFFYAREYANSVKYYDIFLKHLHLDNK